MRWVLVWAMLGGAALAEDGLVLTPEGVVPKGEVPARVTDLSCVLTECPDSCTRFLACIGDDGLWLNGRSRGRGTVDGIVSDGRTCGGVWSQDEAGASARVFCEGLGLMSARATYQDRYTGPTTGTGVSVDGKVGVTFWSGLNVQDLLDPETGERKGPPPCIPAEALVS